MINVLGVGAHPDDIELGCFGTLAKHSMNGDKIFGAIITEGELVSNPKKRRKETDAAAKIIDMNLFYGNFPDGNLEEKSPLISFLDKIIKKYRIQIMYTHTVNDRHQDHRIVARASIAAARNVKELYSYETPNVIYPFNPHYFVDVTNTFEKKISAIKKHKSQAKKIYMQIDATQGLAKFRAYQCGIRDRLCEAFEIQKILRQ